VRINGRVDLAVRDLSKVKLRTKQAGIDGSANDDNWLVHHSDVVVTERAAKPRLGDGSDMKTDTDIYVVPCANGWGQAGENQAQLTERIGQVYVSTGRRMVKGQSSGIALLRGGITTIRLYGPKAISSGQRVCVVAPDPNNPVPFELCDDAPQTRIPWWIVPFDEVHSLGSIDNAHQLLTRMDKFKLQEYQRNFPGCALWAQVLGRHIMAATMLSVSALLDAGVIVIKEREEWGRAGQLDEKKRLEKLVELGRELTVVGDYESAHGGASRGNGSSGGGDSSHSPLQIPSKMAGSNATIDLRTLLIERFFGIEREYRIVNPQRRDIHGTSMLYDSPEYEQLADLCNNDLRQLHASFKRADNIAQRLVIGTAMTSAKPSQDIDVHIGSNLAGC
jgi:hypothetical protein